MVLPLLAGLIAPYAIEAFSGLFSEDEEEEFEEMEEEYYNPPAQVSTPQFEEEEEEEEIEDKPDMKKLPQLPKSVPPLMPFLKSKLPPKPSPKKGLAAARKQRRGFRRLGRR